MKIAGTPFYFVVSYSSSFLPNMLYGSWYPNCLWVEGELLDTEQKVCLYFPSGTVRQAQLREWLCDLQRSLSGGSYNCSGTEKPTQLWICVNVSWKWGWPNTAAQRILNPVLETKNNPYDQGQGVKTWGNSFSSFNRHNERHRCIFTVLQKGNRIRIGGTIWILLAGKCCVTFKFIEWCSKTPQIHKLRQQADHLRLVSDICFQTIIIPSVVAPCQ